MTSVVVRHVGIVVQDLDYSLRFWNEGMGFKVFSHNEESGSHIDNVMGAENVAVTTVKLQDENGMIIELLKFDNNNSNLKWDGTPFTTGITHIALTVDDIDKCCQKLTKFGATFHCKPQCSPDKSVKFLYCRGPENLILEIVSHQ